jgi:hypothetical protein
MPRAKAERGIPERPGTSDYAAPARSVCEVSADRSEIHSRVREWSTWVPLYH